MCVGIASVLIQVLLMVISALVSLLGSFDFIDPGLMDILMKPLSFVFTN
jgi:hypothetical protein